MKALETAAWDLFPTKFTGND